MARCTIPPLDEALQTCRGCSRSLAWHAMQVQLKIAIQWWSCLAILRLPANNGICCSTLGLPPKMDFHNLEMRCSGKPLNLSHCFWHDIEICNRGTELKLGLFVLFGLAKFKKASPAYFFNVLVRHERRLSIRFLISFEELPPCHACGLLYWFTPKRELIIRGLSWTRVGRAGVQPQRKVRTPEPASGLFKGQKSLCT